MSENIEFIAAKDLPEATGDEVSVLCLEGNELKQKPGASLGGGSYDFVVKLRIVDDGDGWGKAEAEVVSGITYEDAMVKLNDGKTLTAFIQEDCTNLPSACVEDGITEWLWNGEVTGMFTGGDGGVIRFYGWYLGFDITPDNNITGFWD